MRQPGKILIILAFILICIFVYTRVKLKISNNSNRLESLNSSSQEESKILQQDSFQQDLEPIEGSSAKDNQASQESKEEPRELKVQESPDEEFLVKEKSEPISASAADPNIKIRIIKKPTGEEPDWVNEAWIGLEIPVLKGSYQQKGGQEVISGKFRSYDNYAVPLEIALSILKEKSPEAEKWWRENANLSGVFAIGFDRDVCELIGAEE